MLRSVFSVFGKKRRREPPEPPALAESTPRPDSLGAHVAKRVRLSDAPVCNLNQNPTASPDPRASERDADHAPPAKVYNMQRYRKGSASEEALVPRALSQVRKGQGVSLTGQKRPKDAASSGGIEAHAAPQVPATHACAPRNSDHRPQVRGVPPTGHNGAKHVGGQGGIDRQAAPQIRPTHPQVSRNPDPRPQLFAKRGSAARNPECGPGFPAERPLLPRRLDPGPKLPATHAWAPRNGIPGPQLPAQRPLAGNDRKAGLCCSSPGPAAPAGNTGVEGQSGRQNGAEPEIINRNARATGGRTGEGEQLNQQNGAEPESSNRSLGEPGGSKEVAGRVRWQNGAELASAAELRTPLLLSDPRPVAAVERHEVQGPGTPPRPGGEGNPTPQIVPGISSSGTTAILPQKRSVSRETTVSAPDKPSVSGATIKTTQEDASLLHESAISPPKSALRAKRKEQQEGIRQKKAGGSARKRDPAKCMQMNVCGPIREAQLAAMAQPMDLGRPYVVDPSAQARVAEVREMYSQAMIAGKAENQKKPDMQYFKKTKGSLTPEHMTGHVPGIELGQKFVGKGEIAILGIHCNISGGIYSKGEMAFAVVSAGGYKDDDDQGSSFIYTGSGGQKKGVQVENQKWTKGNAALRNAFNNKQPVRVCRSYTSTDRTHNIPTLVYCGLYSVTSADLVAGKDGFEVCQFRFEPIPGHSVDAKPVPLRPLFTCKPRVRLASALVPRKRSKDRDSAGSQYDRGKLVCADIAVGEEAVRIPVYNSVDDARLEGSFTYIRESRVGTHSEAGAVIALADDVFVDRSRCAFKADTQLKRNPPYLADGRLTEITGFGIHECPDTCRAPLCRQNRVVTGGIRAKLEVFRTAQRGWGVRAGSFLDVGTFICTYEGEICTDQEADKLRGDDEYLYELDHFHKLLGTAEESGVDGFPALEDLARVCPRDDEGDRNHLVVDAKHMGNVGRFINHSCSPNLETAVVLTQGCTAVRYRLAFFVGTEAGIAPGEELTYNYGWSPNSNTVLKGLQCQCGAPNCVGALL